MKIITIYIYIYVFCEIWKQYYIKFINLWRLIDFKGIKNPKPYFQVIYRDFKAEVWKEKKGDLFEANMW